MRVVPRLGAYTYPAYDLTKIREAVKAIAELGGKTTLSALAQRIKMSEKGGAFMYLVAALSDYGVANRTKNLISLTELGEKIAKPIDEDELRRALTTAFFNVELFKKLYEKAGNTVPEDHVLMAYLLDITGQDRLTISKSLRAIKKIYSTAVNILPPKEIKVEETRKKGSIEETAEDWAYLESNYFEFKVKKDPRILDYIKSQFNSWIDFIKEQLESEEDTAD